VLWKILISGLFISSGNWLSALPGTISVFVPELAKVRTGPGTVYDQVGELTKGETAPAIGRSEYSDWVQIIYAAGPDGKGWVFANLIKLQGGKLEDLPLSGAPPTATLPPTPVTLSDLSTSTPYPNRLSTFTPPPVVTPLAFPGSPLLATGFPPAILILGLFAVGLLAAVVAVGRRNVR
jgi:uncharacterized protein YraI